VALSEKIRAEIVRRYAAGESSYSLGRELGINRGTIWYHVQKAGGRHRTPSEAQTRYKADHHFFDEIDTEEKAYWLGMLYTDGSIRDRRVSLALLTTDISHLYKLKTALKATHPVLNHPAKGCQMSILRLSSQPLTDALRSHGLKQRKSWDNQPPVLPADLQPHFWRGCLDGDGTFDVPRKIQYARVALYGTQHMCEGLSNFCKTVTDKPMNVRRCPETKCAYVARLSGRYWVAPFLRALYDDCTVALDRKSTLAKHIISVMEDTPPNRQSPKLYNWQGHLLGQ
jgi:hypothetical protein